MTAIWCSPVLYAQPKELKAAGHSHDECIHVIPLLPTQHFLLDSSAGGGGVAGGAGGAGVNMLYAGLKFTGLALNVAGGLAKAVRQDAERMMKELEADAAAKVGHNFMSLKAYGLGVLSQL